MPNVEWYTVWVKFWNALNSPLIIAILGGILATWLTARWQQRAQLFSLRVEALKKLMDADGDWYNSLFGEHRNDPHFVNQRAGEIIKVANMIQALFPGDDVRAVRKGYLAVAEARTRLVGTTDQAKADELSILSGTKFREFLETLFKRLGVPT